MILVSNDKSIQPKIKDGRICFSDKVSIGMNTRETYRTVEELSGLCFSVKDGLLIETPFDMDTDVILVHFKQDTPISHLISSMKIQRMIYSEDKTEAIFVVHINPMTTHTQDIRVIYKNPAGGNFLQIIRFKLIVKHNSLKVIPTVKLPFEYNNHKLESCYLYIDDNLKVKRNTSVMPKELIVRPGINAKIIQQELKRSFSLVRVMSESDLLTFAQEATKHFTMYGFPSDVMLRARAYVNINITTNKNAHLSSDDGTRGKLVAIGEPRECDCDGKCDSCACKEETN